MALQQLPVTLILAPTAASTHILAPLVGIALLMRTFRNPTTVTATL
jgi:hypothetical protein